MVDPDFIGPRKPAFLTVKVEKLQQWVGGEIIHHFDPWGSKAVENRLRVDIPTELGVTDFEWIERDRNPNRICPSHIRLTFIDDWARFEFAMRYA